MNTMTSSCTVAFSLLLTIAANVSAAEPPAHAKGNPPEKVYWIDEFGEPSTFTFDFVDCNGFGTVMDLTLSGFWIYHPETNGQGAWEYFHSASPTRITNADDATLFVEGIPGQVINRHWTGEPGESDPIETGVQLMVALPGYGVIYRDVGRLRLDWDTFEAVFLAGHWDSFTEDYQALCAALSP